MKHAIKAITILIVLASLLAVSCTQVSDVPAPGCGSVRLSTAEEKELEVLDAGGIDHYEYEAHPQFTLLDGQYLTGETGWKTLEADEGSSEIIGPFTQGSWRFGLRAVTPLGETIWEGAGEGYISESSLSVIPITMHRVEGSGTIVLELEIPESNSSMPNPTVTLDGAAVSITWNKNNAGSGTLSYTGSISNVSAGWHEVVVRFVSGSVEAGDAKAVQVLPSGTVILRGAFEVGEYEEPHLKIDAPLAARSEIRLNGGTVGITSDTMKKGETHTYKYVFTEGRSNATIKWYVNGTESGTGATFAFTPDFNGIYEITALSRYYAKSALGGTWIEESASASTTVLVYPEMCLITWNNGTTIPRQRLPLETVLTVGAPTREGYTFSHWAVTGGYTGNVSLGASFTLTKTAYTFTAVWNENPSIKLALSSGLVLSFGSGSATAVPAEGVLGAITSASSTYPASSLAVRWFLDGKEIFWICDKGGGKYSIPGATEAGIEPGSYPFEARVTCGTKTTSCATTVTWL